MSVVPAVRGNGALERVVPAEAAMKVHTMEAAERIAERAKNVEALEAAVLGKLEAQRDFAAAYRAAFTQGRHTPEQAHDAESYCSRFGFAQRTVQRWAERLLDEARFEVERHERLAKVWRIVEMESAGGAHVSQNSGENEWYTPEHIITAARAAMGGIDLDPASHPDAQRVVRAEMYFTADDDGLSQDWFGRVWMNPPYAQPLIGRFCEKLITELDAGRVTAAITLTNNATETAWGQLLIGRADSACFPGGRVKFWSSTRDTATPLQGQMLCAFGVAAFAACFSAHGCVLSVTR